MFLILLLVLPLALMAGFSILNARTLRRLTDFSEASLPEHAPRVSLMVPARNEEYNLQQLLPTLIAQDYPNLEILLLDDHSTDGTLEVANRFAATHPRLHVLQGGALWPGWFGKPNACRQLAEAATGEILLFTDADTIWRSDAVSLVVKTFGNTKCDALSGWPKQILGGWFSHLIQPLMSWSLIALMPLWLVRNPHFPDVVTANGQLIAFTRKAFDQIGGFAGVKDNILEDRKLAWLIKRAGLDFKFVNALAAVSCRMYTSSREAFDGFAKSAYTNVDANPVKLALAIIGFVWGFIVPWVWLIWSFVNDSSAFWPLLAVAFSVAGRVVSDNDFGFSPGLAFTQPLSVLAWIAVALTSYSRYLRGRTAWKGRSYDLSQTDAGSSPNPSEPSPTRSGGESKA